MKWIFWIIGTLLYLSLRNPNGNDRPGMQFVWIIVLTVFALLGHWAGRTEEKRKARARDAEAQLIADNLLGRKFEPPKPLSKHQLAALDKTAASLLDNLIEAQVKRDDSQSNVK